MTSAHIIFIPGVLLIGVIIGFVLGTRAARDRMNLERKREEEREAARKARAERRAARAAAEERAAGEDERRPAGDGEKRATESSAGSA